MKKIGNSFKGIIGGFILILIGIILLWWNEGNNVKNLKTTAEMDKSLVEISSDKVDPNNEGKLIATSGKIENTEELVDTTFQVKIVTPKMRRIVEVYQWEEDSDTDEDGNTTYQYKKVWKDEIIDSTDFHQSGHDNPREMQYQNQAYESNNVKVGAFNLSPYQIERLSTNATNNSFNEEIASQLGLKIENNYLTTSTDIDNPQIGDMRISFVYNNSTDISILAVQKGNTFGDFVSKAGKTINKVVDGTHSGTEMINSIKEGNKIFKWIFRLLGTLLIVIGIATILGPISTISSYIPILGNVVGAAVGFISLILGIAISLVIIALAWLRYRPMIGIALLAIVVALITLLMKKGKKETPSQSVNINQQVVPNQANQPIESNQQLIQNQMNQPTMSDQVDNNSTNQNMQ